MRYARRHDRWQQQAWQESPCLSPLPGTWFNCDAGTGEILRLELHERDGALWFRTYRAGEPTPVDWGEATAILHVKSFGSREVTGFMACSDWGFMDTRIAAKIKREVQVIKSYNRFLDGSSRPCYSTREFFCWEMRGPGRQELQPLPRWQ